MSWYRFSLLTNCWKLTLIAISVLFIVNAPLVHGDSLDRKISHPASVQWDEQRSTLYVDWFNQHWVIPLSQHSVLNTKRKTDPDLPILYRGLVNGDDNTWARITRATNQKTGNNKHPTFLGYIYFDNALYELHDNANSKAYFVSPVTHNAYRLNQSRSLKSELSYKPQTWNQSKVASRAIDSTNPRKAIKIGIAVDSQYNKHYNNRGLAQALSIINGVDGIFQQQFDLAVIVDDYIVYNNEEDDPLSHIDGTAEIVLDTFRAARLQQSLFSEEVALVHLFTGIKNSDRKIGLSWLNTLCDNNAYNLSLSTPFTFSVLLAAHEIAHNLGATHDNDSACINDNPADTTDLMWPEISGNTQPNFSSCSARQIQSMLNASCVINDIDLSITLATEAAEANGLHDLSMTIQNVDKYRSAQGITSQVTYPSDTLLKEIPPDCSLAGSTIECRIDTINPDSSKIFTITSDFAGSEEVVVSAEVLIDNAVDTQTSNNRHAVILRKSSAYATQNLGDSTTLPPDQPALTSADNNVTDSDNFGLGSSQAATLMVLLAFAIMRLILIGSIYRILRNSLQGIPIVGWR